MSNVNPPDSATNRPPRNRRRLWPWFVVGFFLVFLGMALVYPMYFYDGRAVHQTVLWRYYLLEIKQAFSSTGAIGPTSGNPAAAATTLFMHVVISAVAGAATLGGAWIFQKRSQKA